MFQFFWFLSLQAFCLTVDLTDCCPYCRIYIELSEEFKTMDPATPDVNRRKILASHLKESIDILEMKVRFSR